MHDFLIIFISRRTYNNVFSYGEITPTTPVHAAVFAGAYTDIFRYNDDASHLFFFPFSFELFVNSAFVETPDYPVCRGFFLVFGRRPAAPQRMIVAIEMFFCSKI